MIVTEPPEGAAGGAVNALGIPLGVCVGLKLPHDPAGMQLQFTPPVAESCVTVATTLLTVPAAKVVGAVVIATLSPGPEPHPAMAKAQDVTTKIHRVSLFIMQAFVSEIDCHLIDVFLEIEVTKAGCAYLHAADRRLCLRDGQEGLTRRLNDPGGI